MENLQLNIFKIKDENNIDEIEMIIKEQMKNKRTKRIFNKDIELNGVRYNFDFFFYMTSNENKKIDWYEKIKDIFKIEDDIAKDIYSGYGILLIYNDNIKYVVSFGRAMYLLDKYIDWNFGLEMASKMLDRNAINAQSSKYFSLSKNKSLVVYNNGSFNTEVGESVDLITANITEIGNHSRINDLNNYINNRVAFSSCVKTIVKLEEIKFSDLVTIISDIDIIYRKYPERITIPKLVFLKNDDIMLEKLKEKVNKEILKEDDNTNISLCLYTVLDSEITLLEDIEKYELYYSRCSQEYDNLSIEDIRDFMNKYMITDIEKINLRINYMDRDRIIKLYKLLDYTTEIEGDRNFYCLYNGRWAKFNQNYVDKIKNEIIEINKRIEYEPKYDLDLKENEETIQKDYKDMLTYLNSPDLTLNEDTREKLYREFVYNYNLSKKINGTLLDRKQFNGIEICDIYANNELIHTKIGAPGEFNECINQSIIGMETWNTNKEEIKNKLNIKNVDTVTLLLITQNQKVLKSRDVNEFSSLRFKLNLIEWYSKVDLIGKKSRVIIAKLK